MLSKSKYPKIKKEKKLIKSKKKIILFYLSRVGVGVRYEFKVGQNFGY